MPNNKKNKKNKEKKAARAAAAAAVGLTSAEQSLLGCPHDPACDKCLMAYPPGCLHSLRQDERMSPEMNKIIAVYDRFPRYSRYKFWEQPENAPFANERTVRFFFYQSVKCIVGKDALNVRGLNDKDYKNYADVHFSFMLHLYAVIKLGSDAAVSQAREDDVSSLDEGQLSIRALYRALDGYEDCYYRLVYIMNELSPCSCLETEVKRAKHEDESFLTPLGCSNDDCDKTEASSEENDRFGRCAGCNMAHYCSSRCYKDHWRGHMTSTESSHKIACEAIQELKTLLSGGRGSGGGGGDDDDRSSRANMDDNSA